MHNVQHRLTERPIHLEDGHAGRVTGHLNDSILLLEFIEFFALFPQDLLSADRWVTPATSKAVEDDLLPFLVHQLLVAVTGCLQLS